MCVKVFRNQASIQVLNMQLTCKAMLNTGVIRLVYNLKPDSVHSVSVYLQYYVEIRFKQFRFTLNAVRQELMLFTLYIYICIHRNTLRLINWMFDVRSVDN